MGLLWEIWYVSCHTECSFFKGKAPTCIKEDCAGKTGKTYHCIPLIDRLTQLYSNPHTARQLQSHVIESNFKDTLWDIHESAVWRGLYGKVACFFWLFEGDPRAIALEFRSDGFAPFHHNTSKPYPIEQQASVILNLPPELHTGLVLLHGLILYGELT